MSGTCDSDLTADDGHDLGRTASVGTVSAHMIAAVIGSGVLSLAWAVAQLGWVAGPIVMLLFSFVTNCTCSLLTEIYCRSCDRVTGSSNYTFTDHIHSQISEMQGKAWILIVHLILMGISCTTEASKTMMETKKSICLHSIGGNTDPCRRLSSISYMNIVCGIIQIIISQLIPHGLSYHVVSGGTFVIYTGASVVLSVDKVVANGIFKGNLRGIGGVEAITRADKFWRVLQAIGLITALFGSSSYCLTILTEGQDRFKSEAKTMKKATLITVIVTTIVYMLCGCMGYAAFGDLTPEDLLLLSTSPGHSGFYWHLVDIANVARVIHLMCAYQAYCQPIYALVEKLVANRFRSEAANDHFIIRLVWRSAFVVVTTVVSILMLPFFNDLVGVVGALGFWLLVVHYPMKTYISQKKTLKWSREWVWLRTLSIGTLVLSLAVSASYGYAFLLHVKT